MPSNLSNAINPAFPGGSFSQPNPPVGKRAESFVTRTSSVFYNWAVPPGVTFLKVTMTSATGTGSGTTSFGQYITAAGAGGTPTAGTTRFPQNIGANYLTNAINTTYAGGATGVFYLQNMIPGTPIRITVPGPGTCGVGAYVLVEY